MNKQKNILTKQGYENLKKKLKSLVKKENGTVKEMELARQEGDLSENSAYHQLRETVTIFRNQIGDLKAKLENVKIVKKNNNGIVGVGHQVKVKMKAKQKTFHIVGDGESDPLTGKVSFKSPIGSALIGAKVGDTVKVKTPGGVMEYEILEIK